LGLERWAFTPVVPESFIQKQTRKALAELSPRQWLECLARYLLGVTMPSMTNCMRFDVAGLALVTVVAWLIVGWQPPASADENDALVEMVVGLLAEEDTEMRALAHEQIRSELPGENATKVFAAQLEKLSGEAKVGLISALAERGDPAAKSAILLELDSSEDAAVRSAALKALGFLGDPGDVALLIKFFVEGTKPEQAAAESSLVRLPDTEVTAAILAELENQPPPVQADMVEILTQRRATEALPMLIEMARGDIPLLRYVSMQALADLAGKEHLPELLQAVLKASPGKEREYAEKALASVCRRLDDPQAASAAVISASGDLSPRDQLALLPALGRIGGEPVLAVVQSSLAKEGPWRAAGVRAICNWPNASVADQLLELAQNAPSEGDRLAALRAFIRVAPTRDDRTNAERLKLLQTALDMATRDAERELVINRARTVLDIESLRFLAPFMDDPQFAQQACWSVVELAHHREVRDGHEDEFNAALDKVIAISADPTVIDRAQRYQRGETWYRPKQEKTRPDFAATVVIREGERAAPSQPLAAAGFAGNFADPLQLPLGIALCVLILAVIVVAFATGRTV